ncbi:hypothetical protein [Pseudomonas sp. D3-10]|uniref:hypothetical protein n=1 Tax=Pseudomonas sp. D3-10 TaxID=2817392 RepID=UPI003DA8503E
MFVKKALSVVALYVIAQSAWASDSWTLTANGKDPSSDADATTTEYVVESSISKIRGNYRTAFVKTVFTPTVPLMPGRSVAFTIAEVMVGCNDFTWGTTNRMDFDEHMVPVMSEIGEFDKSKSIWTLKNMGALDSSATTFKTARFICSASVREY